MLKLPTDPGPNADFYTTIRYLQSMATYLGANTIVLEFNQRALLTMTDQLQSDLDRNTAAVSANTAASTVEMQQLKDAIAAIVPGTPVTQAQLDQLNAASAALEASTTALASDDPTAPATGSVPSA